MNENGDSSNYNSLQVSVNRRQAHGLSYGVNYTFSRTLDTSSGTPQDSYNAGPDYGLSGIHRKHVLNFNYVYELPFLRKHPVALVRQTLGGWEISGITSFQSGAPFNVTRSHRRGAHRREFLARLGGRPAQAGPGRAHAFPLVQHGGVPAAGEDGPGTLRRRRPQHPDRPRIQPSGTSPC